MLTYSIAETVLKKKKKKIGTGKSPYQKAVKCIHCLALSQGQSSGVCSRFPTWEGWTLRTSKQTVKSMQQHDSTLATADSARYVRGLRKQLCISLLHALVELEALWDRPHHINISAGVLRRKKLACWLEYNRSVVPRVWSTTVLTVKTSLCLISAKSSRCW